ncbi:Coactosin-like protein [Labeo rohita]|uniref:Coactosin-like protein n=1 Tax=Labeo rohita TaxID=84645 RepID=A0ABQ8LS36_LABRO|nr:Coactosin-like protein [Labeo rohita]
MPLHPTERRDLPATPADPLCRTLGFIRIFSHSPGFVQHLDTLSPLASSKWQRELTKRLAEKHIIWCETTPQMYADDNRLFGFVRITTGDAMSKRAKFTLITWIGENVSGLQRAKISTDKTLVKDIVQNFAKEFMISDPRELEEEYLRTELKKAGGANYDAQAE